MKKIISISILIAVVIVVFYLSFFKYGIIGKTIAQEKFHVKKLERNNIDLKADLIEFKDKKARLQNMTKTLTLMYNISKYEAYYYSVIFDDFSIKDSIPWEIYPALIRIESNFNPTVMSSARCKGLTQVAEKTGEEVAQKLGINFNEATLWNDILNMVIGFTYFDEGIKDSVTNETIQEAIKRYCGGPGYAKMSQNSQAYVGEYKTTLWQEFVKLRYVYMGILYEQDHSVK